MKLIKYNFKDKNRQNFPTYIFRVGSPYFRDLEGKMKEICFIAVVPDDDPSPALTRKELEEMISGKDITGKPINASEVVDNFLSMLKYNYKLDIKIE